MTGARSLRYRRYRQAVSDATRQTITKYGLRAIPIHPSARLPKYAGQSLQVDHIISPQHGFDRYGTDEHVDAEFMGGLSNLRRVPKGFNETRSSRLDEDALDKLREYDESR